MFASTNLIGLYLAISNEERIRNENYAEMQRIFCEIEKEEGVIDAEYYLDKEPRLLHLAAQFGHYRAFYRLMGSLNKSKQNFNAAQFYDKEGRTPFHIAAYFGYNGFFIEPTDKNEKEVWQILKKEWLNKQDQHGKTVLHHALSYRNGSQAILIKHKKATVRTLIQLDELDVNVKDNNHQTALHLVAENGYYETAKELVKSSHINFEIKDDKQLSAKDIAEKKGHQRISNAISFYHTQKNKPMKAVAQNEMISDDAIIAAAKNSNLSEEEFMLRLKTRNNLHVIYKGKKISVIQLRIDALKKKYRHKHVKYALISAICPAAAAAVFFGGFGGINPLPELATIVTLIALPFVYFPMAYFAYKSRSHEYNHVASESLYLQWLNAKLPVLQHELIEELEDIRKKIPEASSVAQLKMYEKQIAEKEAKITEIIDMDDAKKPKLKMHYMSREELKGKRNLGVHDNKKNDAWVGRRDKLSALFRFNSDVLCSASSGVGIGSVVMSLLLGKIGVGFLGAAGSFLLGPAGAILGTIAVAALVGLVIYKVSYKNDKAEIGKANREFVQAYDACKRNAKLETLRDKLQQTKQALNEQKKELSQDKPREEKAPQQEEKNQQLEKMENKEEQRRFNATA